MSTKIQNIKSRLGRNSFDRHQLGSVGLRTPGELRRATTLRADHKRSLAEQFGYPTTITLKQHWDMANRNGVAYNLCYEITRDCWRAAPIVFDGDEDLERRTNNPTEFEKAVDEHFERLRVWDFLEDLDYAQRPMRYGALMMVTKGKQGEKSTDELVRLPTIDYLIDMRVYHEAQLPVETAVQDPLRPDYGQPIMFSIRTNVAGSTNEWENSGQQVHASRVYAYGENAMGNSIYGVPALEASFEALMDLMKVRGSAAEGFFQNAGNRYINTLPDNATAADAEVVVESMHDFDNSFSRSAVTVGDIKTLQTQLNDPTNPWTIALNEACAAHSKPAKIVIGMQTGERASTEDIRQWNRVVMDRQGRECNRMIKGFIRYLQEKFTFPKESKEIIIQWRDLNELSQAEQVKTVLDMASVNEKQIKSKLAPVFSTKVMQTVAQVEIEDVLDGAKIDIGNESDELIK